uniref:WW domain-containing protein n=2 Tax=Graphocephala atropunctata TaxID=36148 RepID=A0A1B6KMT8_9HEMI
MTSFKRITDVNPLPPGWDCKFDNITGKRYFINYFTRHTSMEDPRVQLESIPLQEFSSNTRLGLMMGTNSLKRQQSAADSQQTTSTEQSVTKISAMFPTVTETHIRTLLLKYLKSVFPVVEETILLDTLSSSDNNVHQATQTLMTMGFDKRATPPPRVCLQRQTPAPPTSPPHTPSHPPPRMKSVEEKQEMKVRLREKHPDIAERVVSIALDSVDYDEARADQILGMMADDRPADRDTGASGVGQEEMTEIIIEEPSQAPSPESAPDSPSRRGKDGRWTDTVDGCRYRSALSQQAVGPDSSLRHGPNQALLLPDYVAWTGSNVGLARGPDPRHRGCHDPARGPDTSLRKGPNRSLAKGSIYNQLAQISLVESRGK